MQRIAFFLFFIYAGYVFGQNEKLVILHTNDLHSNLTGFGPELDYSPLSVNDDQTSGGFARLQTLIQKFSDTDK